MGLAGAPPGFPEAGRRSPSVGTLGDPGQPLRALIIRSAREDGLSLRQFIGDSDEHAGEVTRTSCANYPTFLHSATIRQ